MSNIEGEEVKPFALTVEEINVIMVSKDPKYIAEGIEPFAVGLETDLENGIPAKEQETNYHRRKAMYVTCESQFYSN